MPTETERRVIRLLTSVEIPPTAGELVEQWGDEAVTVVCEAALGTYSSLHSKVRKNATALLGFMTHPQARETVTILVGNEDPDVAIRAMRAAGRQKNEQVVDTLGEVLGRDSAPLIAAEALKALAAIDTQAARARVDTYAAASEADPPHRRSSVVQSVLERLGKF